MRPQGIGGVRHSHSRAALSVLTLTLGAAVRTTGGLGLGALQGFNDLCDGPIPLRSPHE